MIWDFLKQKHKCSHPHICADADEAYCPDCGELIKNKWYLVRCSCCNIKRPAHGKFDEIIPDTKYCPNCGSSEYYVQELSEINYTDLQYAVLKSEVIIRNEKTINQIWIEKEEHPDSTKLLEIYK